MQRGGVIPVVQMAVVLVQTVNAAQRGVQARDQVGGGDPAKLACTGDGQQVQPDVGGRCAVGHRAFRRHLQVVGRQKMIVGAYQFFKELPGLAGQLIGIFLFVRAEPGIQRRRGRLADPPCRHRGQRPQGKKSRAGNGMRTPQRCNRQNGASRRCQRMLADEGPQRVTCCGLSLFGGGPLQQLLVAKSHAPDGAQRGVEQQPGLDKQLAELPQRSQRTPAQIPHAHIKKMRPGNAASCGNQPGQCAKKGTCEESGQCDGQRGTHGHSACEHRQSQQQHGHRHDAGAAQVVHHAPQAQRVNAVVARTQHQRQQLPVTACPAMHA